MPRSGSTPFSYQYPAGTVAVSGQPISSVAYNASLTDMTNNVFNAAWPITYGGTGTVDGSALVPDGSASAPGVRFQNETNTGFYRVSAGIIGVSVLGVQVGTYTATGFSPATPFIITSTDAGATAGPIVDLYRNSASPAASDVIGQLIFNGKDSATNKQEYADIQAVISDATSTSEDGILQLRTVVAGTVANRVSVGAGLFTAGATGGDQGANSVNASSYYIAGAAFGRPAIGTEVSVSSTATTLTSVYPSYASVLLLQLDSVSTNGTDSKIIQLGTGGVIATSGYIGSASFVGGTNTAGGNSSTAGMEIKSIIAADNLSGTVTISLLKASTHRYLISFTGSTGTNFTFTSSAIITLSGVLDSIRIGTTGGTNTFDNGTITPVTAA